MIVYSGCHESVDAITHWSHKDINRYNYPFYRFYDEGSISCIYTGDVDLNVVNLEMVFKNYWKYVGTVQVPHHGSLKDFDSTFMTKASLICPVSYGKTNTYGHPSLNVLSQIKSKGCIPLNVTEDLDSGAIQIIELF